MKLYALYKHCGESFVAGVCTTSEKADELLREIRSEEGFYSNPRYSWIKEFVSDTLDEEPSL